MNNLQKICTAGLCFLYLGAFNTAHAKAKNIHKNTVSNADLQKAYKRLVLTTGKHQFSGNKKVEKRQETLRKKNFVSNRVLATAKKQLNKKYRWGGTTPRRGFDCSGLMQYAYRSANIKLPRTAAGQYRFTKRISLSHLKVGDLIFFHTRRRSRSRINHVGLYMGGGNFIHAPRRGKRVSISKLDRYWKRRAVGAGRV